MVAGVVAAVGIDHLGAEELAGAEDCAATVSGLVGGVFKLAGAHGTAAGGQNVEQPAGAGLDDRTGAHGLGGRTVGQVDGTGCRRHEGHAERIRIGAEIGLEQLEAAGRVRLGVEADLDGGKVPDFGQAEDGAREGDDVAGAAHVFAAERRSGQRAPPAAAPLLRR